MATRSRGRLQGARRRHESLEAVFEDATGLFGRRRRANARRARPQEVEAARTTGVEETERLVHGATGLVQGLDAALRGLKEAQERAGEAPPAWLRKLLDSLS